MGIAKKRHHPLATINRARDHYGIRAVICSVSCGGDSVASLDLCVKHFDRVEAFFMYVVRGLSFQEKYLGYLERRYGIAIARIPHWGLANTLQHNIWRHPTTATNGLTRLKPRHAEEYVRQLFGLQWIVKGIKYSDSIERNTQVVQSDCGVSVKQKQVWPLAWWKHGDVTNYLAMQGIMAPPDYRLKSGVDGLQLKHSGSFSSLLWPDEIIPIRDNYPEDYAKIVKMFPLVPAQIQRHEQLQRKGKLRGPTSGKGKQAISG